MTAATGAGESRSPETPPREPADYQFARLSIAQVIMRLSDTPVTLPARRALTSTWNLLNRPEQARSHEAICAVLFKAGELIGTLERNGDLS